MNIVSEMLLSGSIGIIGGADGPTAVFITAGEGWYIPVLVVAAAAVSAIWLIVKRRKK